MSAFDDALRALGRTVGGLSAAFRSGAASVPQARVEERLFALMVEFPQLPDEQIALFARDEIIAHQGNDPAFLEWATAETVARIRRTVLLAHARQQAAEHAAQVAAGNVPCAACRRYIRAGSLKCIHCGAWT
ncbi:MAG: hypothetical protein JST00_46815 [Deltaproteobacteria bacterium]|nr:hypothetical protein [Deltaproteobacteria bacterium]